jgi:hypothetical protein
MNNTQTLYENLQKKHKTYHSYFDNTYQSVFKIKTWSAVLTFFSKTNFVGNGIYPNIWADGYISPIFKNDDPSSPSSYRGITITSAIGKLFNNILNIRLNNLKKKELINTSVSDWFY